MKKPISILLSILMILSCVQPLTMGAFAISSSEMPEGTVLTSSTKYNVAPGVTEEHIVTVDSEGNNQNQSYVATFDFSSGLVGAMAGYKDYDTSGKWGMQTVRDQARKAEEARGKNIVVAINGDYYNMSTGEPLNYLVMNGKVVHSTCSEGTWYFGITNEGKPVIRPSTEPLDDIVEAVGSPLPLVIDGHAREDIKYDPAKMPRNGIGLTADGKVVVILNDGRQAPKSVGYTLYEYAKMMEAYGCVTAIYLDGGGSATYASKSEGTNALTVKNSPSDGNERLVSSSLFFYSTAVDTEEFDHASLSPNNEVYTPYSTVIFSAIGVNKVGAPADLPEDGTFALADESFGAISEEGIFNSSGKTGTVVVNYISGGEVKGTTSIEIQTPDSISFAQDEVSLGFSASSTLGLIVKYQNREINYNENDILWTLSDNSMGSFSGLVFTSSDSATVTGKITASSKYDETVNATIDAVIGRLPSVVLDFEDHVNDDETVTEAKDYWSITHGGVLEPGGGSLLNRDAVDTSARLVSATYGRGCNTTAEIVDIDNGEVRFGSHALKINYDFTGYIAGTEGANVGLMEATQKIEGSPTGIGIWVYAPERSANLWLRLRVQDGTGTVQTVNFTGTEGVNWTGWKYLEANISNLTGPFSLIGGETIRCLYLTAAGGSGQKTLQNGEMVDLAKPDQKGCLYFDNVQFVYGANNDDTENPVVNSIQANLNEIGADSVVDTNKVSFRISYADVINKNSTGVNPDSLAVYIDGKDMTDACVIQQGDEMIYLDDLMLVNGSHSIKVRVRDYFNNETIETRSFTVSGSENFNTVIARGSETATLGKDFKLSLSADDVAAIKSMSVNLKIDSAFADGCSYAFADGFDGTVTYNAKTSTFAISANQKEDFESADSIIDFTFKIPASTPEGKSFTYSASNGSFETQGDYQKTFSIKNTSVAVAAPISVEVATMVVGADKGTIKVNNADGTPAADAEVYLEGTEEAIGVTDENGVLETSVLNETVRKYSAYAKRGDDISFKVSGQTFAPAPVGSAGPEFISISATKNSETGKSITWLSNPVLADKAASVCYAEKATYEKDGESAFVTAEAVTVLYSFNGSSDINSNYAVNINSCELSGLKRDTEYVYKVADGDVASDIKSFKTSINGERTNFFIIGDTQTADKTNQNKIFENLSTSGIEYNFGIQTGDSIESANVYGDWVDNLELYSGEYMSTVDIVHVLGNHEYMGDLKAEAASTIYNIPSTEVYSVQYGNVYVATMGFTNIKSEITERLEWIKQDSAKSDAQWKILTIHQPPFYTNGTSPSTEMNELVPPAMKEAGFDFVFSGHDHTYTRTPDIDGTTYYICGTTGGKAYGFTNNSFEYAEKTDDFEHEGYSGIYLTASADETKLTVTTRYANGDILDEYTKVKEICENGLHTYTYTSDEYLRCSVCGYTVKAEKSHHTGMIIDADTGEVMYVISGVPQTSRWITNGEDYYYIGADGKAVTGTQQVTDADGKVRTYTFDEKGVNIAGSFVEEEITNPTTLETRTITRYYLGGRFLRSWNVIGDDLYHFYRTNKGDAYNEGAMFTGEKTVKTPGKNTERKFVFSEDGKLLVGALEDEYDLDGNYAGTRYYWGDEYLTDTTVTVNGFEYTLDKNGYVVNTTGEEEWTVALSYDSVAYSGSAKKPAVTVKRGDTVLLSGQHYTVSYSDNKEVGTATVTVTGKNSVLGTKTANFTIKPAKAGSLSAKVSSDNKSIVLSWGESKGASAYRVLRSTEPDGTYTKIADIKGTTFTDTTAAAATTYYYKVRGYKTVGGDTIVSAFSDAVKAGLKLGNASGLKAEAAAYNKVKLTWTAVSGATGYKVYRSTSKDGKYTKVGTATKNTYIDSSVKTGTKYYYKVCAFKTENGTDKTSAYTSVVSATAVLSKVSGLKVSSSAYNKVSLKWTAVSGATSYDIYRATSKSGKYTKVGTATKASFTDSSVKTGTKYYYKVRAVIKVDKTNVTGAFSSLVSVTPALAKVAVKSVTASGKKAVIKWSKVSGASGYTVYQATSKSGSLKKIATVKSGSITSYTTKTLKVGSYYYVVKAYRTVSSKTVSGAASSRMSVKIK